MKILYIENEERDRARLQNAVLARAAHTGERPMILRAIENPDNLLGALDEHYDLVLADVRFPNEDGKEIDRLSEIIKTVKDWSQKNNLGRSLPIIAYTSAGPDFLKSCLDRRDDLYDIWDKSTASADYVTWRFEQLSLDLARARPDSLLQRLIRTMSGGARWNQQVVRMTQEYSKGWTEVDQITRVGSAIHLIGKELGCLEHAQRWWAVMCKSEPLSRASSHSTRGHGRHVINVFWLGYVIIHEPLLKRFWADCYARILTERQSMGPVGEKEPLEALSDAWFYAGLFHDIAGCCEKFHGSYKSVTGVVEMLCVLEKFPSKVEDEHAKVKENLLNPRLTSEGKELSEKFFAQLADTTKKELYSMWRSGLNEGEPDHGVVAGIEIISSISKGEQNCLAREAARGMVVHNLVGKIKGSKNIGVTWEDEPIVALLLLCDQLQTWDRERGDDNVFDDPTPTQAELLYLEVVKVKGRPVVKMGIHYIGARILTQSSEMFDRALFKLEDVLQKFPLPAINRIEGKWPFGLEVHFWLNGRRLNTSIQK